ncbi:MAG TPA: class I SAM-dependent methyltransferase [Tepidisphaeraceae bacterium]|nr:class I SAM-dependent methyltransferase [Tepidisphaeraceae bacterium]
MACSEDVGSHYAGEEGKEYVKRHQSQFGHLGHKLNFQYFRPYLRPQDVVLDFGCGNGSLLAHIKANVVRAEGLEVNPSAREIAVQAGCRIYSSLDELPSEPTYDVIVTNHVLEHISDVCATLRRLRQCLRIGGLLVAKLPIEDFRAPHQRRWSANDPDHHLHTWTPLLFGNVLYDSGLDVRECRVVTSAWHPKLFPLVNIGLGRVACWALAVLLKRRQLLAIGVRKE